LSNPLERITSTQNPYVKKVVAVRKDGLVRTQEGVFFLEGERSIEEALARNIAPIELIYVPRMLETEPPVIEKCSKAGTKLVSVSKDVYKKISDTKNPIWIAGLFEIPNYSLPKVIKKNKGLYLIATNVQDPGNLGTIWRNAACFGAEALLVGTPACDLYNGKVLRASSGAVFAIPAVKARPKDIVSALQEADIPIYGADVNGKLLLTELQGKTPVAVALGHETQGIHPDVERCLAGSFRIPMQNDMDSLNVAATSAVVLYEIVRNRIF